MTTLHAARSISPLRMSYELLTGGRRAHVAHLAVATSPERVRAGLRIYLARINDRRHPRA